MVNWNEEKILNSPFNWILKLTEQEYVNKINTVRGKFKVKKVDNRFTLLQKTGLFDDEAINNYLKYKEQKELNKITKVHAKLSPF